MCERNHDLGGIKAFDCISSVCISVCERALDLYQNMHEQRARDSMTETLTNRFW